MVHEREAKREGWVYRAGLARPGVLVVCVVLLLVGYGVLGGALLPRVMPGWFDARPDEPMGGDAGADLAQLQAVELILETVQGAVDAGEFSRARTVLEAAVKQFPRDQTLRLSMGDLFLNMSRPKDGEGDGLPLTEEQLELVRRAYAEYRSALAIGPRTPEMEFTAGTLARELEDLDSAAIHFSAAMAGDASVAAYPLHLAQVHMKRSEYEAAKAQLARSIAIEPDQAIAWGMMAEIALVEGVPRMALDQASRAIALDGSESAYVVIKARAHNRLMEPAEAIRTLAGLPTEKRHSGLVLRLAGQSYGLLRDPAAAFAMYEEALSAGRGTDFEIVFEAAQWAERAGQIERAVELSRQGSMGGHEGSSRLLERLKLSPGVKTGNP
jgi:predicted Zn-dependent protease